MWPAPSPRHKFHLNIAERRTSRPETFFTLPKDTPKSSNLRGAAKMAALASKSQSQKIFEKLRTKPANRVSMPHASLVPRGKMLTFLRTLDMLRLRAEKSYLDISAFRNLSLPRLLFKSPQPRCSYLLCAIHKS